MLSERRENVVIPATRRRRYAMQVGYLLRRSHERKPRTGRVERARKKETACEAASRCGEEDAHTTKPTPEFVFLYSLDHL